MDDSLFAFRRLLPRTGDRGGAGFAVVEAWRGHTHVGTHCKQHYDSRVDQPDKPAPSRCSEPGPAVWLRDKSNAGGGWPRSLTLDFMRSNNAPRCCPACGHRFIPWGSWRISQWSCLPCPSCGVRLNRRHDAQFFVVWVTWLVVCCLVVAFLPLLGTPVVAVVAMAVVSACVASVVDALTIRLVVAGKWRGLLGYEV